MVIPHVEDFLENLLKVVVLKAVD